MNPELAGLLVALEALADPITPMPAAPPAKGRNRVARRLYLGTRSFLRGVLPCLPE